MPRGLNIGVRRTRREGKGLAALVLPELRAAAHYAADQAIRLDKRETRSKIQQVGLGRLSNAVDATSSLQKKRTDQNFAWGAIFTRAKPGSRTQETLLAYSEGANIYPTAGKQWLAFPTDSIPQRVGRKKMTPALYRQSGLVNSIGKLVFIQKSSTRAALIVRKVNVSRRTGRASARGPRKSRGADQRGLIVAFILIKFTSRARRFSQDALTERASNRVPYFVEQYQGRQR